MSNKTKKTMIGISPDVKQTLKRQKLSIETWDEFLFQLLKYATKHKNWKTRHEV